MWWVVSSSFMARRVFRKGQGRVRWTVREVQGCAVPRECGSIALTRYVGILWESLYESS
jgi:hypothetical protein